MGRSVSSDQVERERLRKMLPQGMGGCGLALIAGVLLRIVVVSLWAP